jgi:type I restriction enzyme M protein
LLTDPKLRSQVDALWDKFWTGGLTNPLDAIEQFSYLLFLKRLDDCENADERQAKRKGTTYQPSVKKEMRWGYWTQMKAEGALSHLKNVVFPGLVDLADEKSSFGDASRMKGAQCKIDKAGLPVLSEVEGLIKACNLIDQMKIADAKRNQDVQGDTSAWLSASLYEYMPGHMQ